jgi:hypothetical protein
LVENIGENTTANAKNEKEQGSRKEDIIDFTPKFMF